VVIGEHPAEAEGVHPAHAPTPHTLYVPAAAAAAAAEPLKPSAYYLPHKPTERTIAVPLPQRLVWAALGAAVATAATWVTPWALTKGVNHARSGQRRAARLWDDTRTYAAHARSAASAALRPVVLAARPAVTALRSVRRGFVTRRRRAKEEVRHPPPSGVFYHPPPPT